MSGTGRDTADARGAAVAPRDLPSRLARNSSALFAGRIGLSATLAGVLDGREEGLHPPALYWAES